MKKRKISIFITAILAIILLVGLSRQGRVDSETIKIGFIGSLTGADPSYGEAVKGGVEEAVDEINNSGGVNGKKIQVIYEDGKCIDSKAAVSAFQKLTNVDHVKVIIGGGCSNEVLSISKLVDSNKIFLLSSGATSPDISGLSRYIFRNSANDTETSRQLAEKIYSDGYNNIAIMSDNTDYSVGFRKSFLNEFSKLGGTAGFDITVEPNKNDYRSDVLKLKAANPKVIFVNPTVAKSTGLLIKQIKEAGINSKIYMGYNATSEFFKIVGDGANGATVINLPIVEGSIASKVLTKFENKYGHKSVYEYNTVAAYDAMMVTKEAIVKVGYNPDKMSEYVSTHSFFGGLGNFSFNSQGDVFGIKFLFQIIDGQKLVTIK